MFLIIISICGAILTWRFLTKKHAPPIFASTKTSLMLLLMIVLVLMRSYTMTNQLLELERELVNAEMIIRQG